MLSTTAPVTFLQIWKDFGVSLIGYSGMLNVAFTKNIGNLSFALDVLWGLWASIGFEPEPLRWNPSPRLWTTREFPTPGNMNKHELTQRSPRQNQNEAQSKPSKHQCPDTTCQSFNKTETRCFTLADSLPKTILNPQTLQNLLLDMMLHFRKIRSSLSNI